MNDELTPEQIQNWRRVLCMVIGPYALFMADDDIRAYRNHIQARVDTLTDSPALEQVVNCACDTSYYGATTHKDGTVTCNHCQKIRGG